jgi:chemotaxis protein MotB
MFTAKRENRTRVSDDGERKWWLLTFNDMLTLLLTFFVLILSMSRMDPSKMREASGAVGSAFGIPGPEEKTEVRVFDPFILSSGEFSAGEQDRAAQGKADVGYQQFLKSRDSALQEINRSSGMNARTTPNGLSVRMDSALFFEDGAVQTGPRSETALAPVCALLKECQPFIRIEAYTNETPADREKYPTSWELAAARGAGVAHYLASACRAVPERVSVSGYAVKPASRVVKDGQGLPDRRIEVAVYFMEGERR